MPGYCSQCGEKVYPDQPYGSANERIWHMKCPINRRQYRYTIEVVDSVHQGSDADFQVLAGRADQWVVRGPGLNTEAYSVEDALRMIGAAIDVAIADEGAF